MTPSLPVIDENVSNATADEIEDSAEDVYDDFKLNSKSYDEDCADDDEDDYDDLELDAGSGGEDYDVYLSP